MYRLGLYALFYSLVLFLHIAPLFFLGLECTEMKSLIYPIKVQRATIGEIIVGIITDIDLK